MSVTFFCYLSLSCLKGVVLVGILDYCKFLVFSCLLDNPNHMPYLFWGLIMAITLFQYVKSDMVYLRQKFEKVGAVFSVYKRTVYFIL